MTRVATLKIAKCHECPNLKVGPSYSMDGLDQGRDWLCTKANKEIAGFVEWKRDEPKALPKWCPLLGQKEGT